MSKFRQLHPSIKIRLYLQFATNLATMTIMPFIAIYFSRLVGETITGILVISVIVSGIIGGLCGGYWSDQNGRKKLLVLSELGIGLSFLAIAFANSPWFLSPYLSFILFLVNMFCSGIFYPVSTAMIYDLLKKEERNFVFTAMYWIINLSVALGSITGAFLFEEYHFYLFLFVAAISMTSSLITFLFIGETFVKKETKDPRAPSSMWSNYLHVLKDGTYMIFLIGSLLVFSLEGHLTNYIAIHLEKNMTEISLYDSFTINGLNMVGILQAENTLLVVFTVGFVTWLIKNKSNTWKLLFGMSIYVSGYALLSYTASPWALIALMFFISIGELIYVPVHQGLLADLADGSYRSSYLALDSLAGQGQMIIAGAAVTIGGIIPEQLMSGGFLVFGLIGVFMMKYVINIQKSKEQSNVIAK
ncbi:MFS transporter [Oceanobacillus halophilus]|uniref:MFS transporter n=1 Tax=Oceanobacillus halophilus TaxID=930130 RepID=A0A495A3W7_9BACI|nr:MFS transporter [Oceanobacillus halophilus]RKQ33896.1 MFS transporter [Oceanobacillus halophilus]